MLVPSKCKDVSPQCPSGQEDGYRLGWYQGQIDLIDRHDGTPCQIIRIQQKIEHLTDSVHNLIRENQFLRDQISRLEKERD
jgi:hypothetical protein